MEDDFHKARFILFAHSYVGQSLADYLKHFPDLSTRIEKLGSILLFDKRFLRRLIIFNQYSNQPPTIKIPDLESKGKIKVYLQVEKEMKAITQEKQDKYNSALEDYESALLLPAVERAAGNALKNVKSDLEFEEALAALTKTYCKWYYWVVYRYKLPSLRILPFILRLMQL